MKRILTGLISLVLVLSLGTGFTAYAKNIEVTTPEGETEVISVYDTAPKDICAEKVSETTAKINWQFDDFMEADWGYEVLLYNSATKKYEHLKYAKKESCKLLGLKEGCDYAVKIRTYTKAYGKYFYGASSKAFKLSTAPKASSLKSVKYVTKGKAKVTWTKSKKASGYMIIYSTKKNFASKYTNTLPVPKKKTSFVLGGLGNGKYYVKIRPYREVNGVKYLGAVSKVKTVNIKKGASLKEMVNYTKTDLSGRKEIKQLTEGDVDIKKYKTTWDRIKAIYSWHAKHSQEFTDCMDCNNHFNMTINALYAENRKYDDFIYLAAGKFQNLRGTRPIHKWSVFFFAGKEYIIDPRMQGYTKNYTGETYFFVTKNSHYGKKFLFEEWYFYYRGTQISLRNGELVKYKK